MAELPAEKWADEGGLADQVGRAMSYSLKTSQLRKFFAKMTKLHQDLERGLPMETINDKLLMLKPNLAYAAGRKVGGKPLIPKDFYQLLNAVIDKMRIRKSKNDFEAGWRFIQGIVAYHKFHGGD